MCARWNWASITVNQAVGLAAMNDGGLTVTVPVQMVRGGGGGVPGGVDMFRVQKERCEVGFTTVMCFMVVKSQMWERVFIRQDRKGFFCEKVHVSCVVFVFVLCSLCFSLTA